MSVFNYDMFTIRILMIFIVNLKEGLIVPEEKDSKLTKKLEIAFLQKQIIYVIVTIQNTSTLNLLN